MFFLHGFGFKGFSFAVDFISRNMDEYSDGTMAPGRFEEDVCSENVALGKVERISEGVVHMSLGGKMHDGMYRYVILS